MANAKEKRRITTIGTERAQGMLEFAIILPILLMMLFGIIEFGRLLFTYSAVVTAARESSRYGAASGNVDNDPTKPYYYQDCDGIRAAAIRIGSIAGITNTASATNGVVIAYDKGPGAAAVGSGCPAPGPSTVVLNKGDRIIVTVNARFVPMQGLIPSLQPMTITSTVKRTIVVDVNIR